MSPRAARRLAWSLVAIDCVLLAVGFLLGAPGSWPGGLEVGALGFAVAGALIVTRLPRHRIGWLFCWAPSGLFLAIASAGYAHHALVSAPGSLRFGAEAAWLSSFVWAPSAFILLVFTLLLFPDGRPPSPRWRPVGWLAVAACTVIVVVRGVAGWRLRGPELIRGELMLGLGPAARALLLPALVAFALAQVAAAVSMLVRFRRTSGVERQQIKWFAAVALLLLVGWFAGDLVGRWLYAVALGLVPVATCVAILRYRLYEIDRLVSRTLTYAALTAVLGAVYGSGVIGIRQVLPTGRSDLAVAGSTLVVAALFRPMRDRVQALVDRRFNRARYSAEQVAEEFRVRLREEVDLDDVTADLLAVVSTTVEPRQVSLWLRDGRG